MKDLMGQAIWDYYHDDLWENILTETSISELDELPTPYLFRNFSEMNSLEQKALQLAAGKVMDIGAGAGSHSLYLQNERKLDVTALDFSPKSAAVAKLRGVQKVVCNSLLDFPEDKFDTLLLLMNGTGIFETVDNIPQYLLKLEELLAPGGQILLDSTDILYMFPRTEDGGALVPPGQYYGEVDYWIHYKTESEEPITWLYLDFNTLSALAEASGFKTEKMAQEQDSFLARLTKI